MPARRSALVAITLSLAAVIGSPQVMAQAPDDSDLPPATESFTEEQGNEIVHSWALAPGGNDAAGGDGNRPDLSYVADPGSVIEDAVTLYNLSNVPLTFQVYATDAFNDDVGEVAFLGTNEAPVGVGTWVDIGGRDIPVPARTQVTIPITITIPDGARPGDHVGAILAANAATSSSDDGGQITLDRRTGTRVNIRVNGPVAPELAISDIQTDHSSSINPLSGSTTVRYTVENRGNVRLGGTVRASVSGPFGLGERRSLGQEIDDLLPGQSVTLEERFDGVPTLGVVQTTVELVPAADNVDAVDAASRSTLSLALPIGLLLVLLAGILAWLALRAYRRHRDRDGLAPETVAAEEVMMLPESEHQPT